MLCQIHHTAAHVGPCIQYVYEWTCSVSETQLFVLNPSSSSESLAVTADQALVVYKLQS
jgi:hypothetical protein